MMKNKLPSFTLAEMLVVLVIASIVISTGFVMLGIVKKQVAIVQRNFENKQNLYTLKTMLQRDLNSSIAYFDNSKGSLVLKRTKDSISYRFERSYVLRNKDTISIGLEEKIGWLDGNKVNIGIIDAVELSLGADFNNAMLFIKSSKDAAHYINKEGN